MISTSDEWDNWIVLKSLLFRNNEIEFTKKYSYHKKNEITKKSIEGIIFRKYDSVITKKMLKEKFFISTIPLLRKNRWNALKLLSKTRERHFDTWVMFLVCAECIFHKREKKLAKKCIYGKNFFFLQNGRKNMQGFCRGSFTQGTVTYDLTVFLMLECFLVFKTKFPIVILFKSISQLSKKTCEIHYLYF